LLIFQGFKPGPEDRPFDFLFIKADQRIIALVYGFGKFLHNVPHSKALTGCLLTGISSRRWRY
jgi:hypothetical protein